MHPLLRSPKNVLIAILTWLPIVLSAIMVTAMLIGSSWKAATLLLGPPLYLQLFFVISTWYVCKSTELDPAKFINILAKHALSATAMVAVWLQISMLYSETLVLIYQDEIWRTHFNKALPLLISAGFLLYFLSCLFHYLLLAIERAREVEKESLSNNLLASQAELRSLRATIHPHFLFNSLTALSTLTLTEPERARKVCLQLSDFLRYSLKYGASDQVSINDEIQHTENYLQVEKLRLGERLKVKLNIDETCLEENLMPFTLLPLVENAVKHGIQNLVLGGTLRISVKSNFDQLQIEVRNPFEAPAKKNSGEGHGLSNLKRRLNTFYGQPIRLISNTSESTYTVQLQIPKTVVKSDSAPIELAEDNKIYHE